MRGCSRPWSQCPHAQRHQERTLPQAGRTAARRHASTTWVRRRGPAFIHWRLKPAPGGRRRTSCHTACRESLLPAGGSPTPARRSTCRRLGMPTSSALLGWSMAPPGAHSSAAMGRSHAPLHAHSARRLLIAPAKGERDHGRPRQRVAPARPGKHPMRRRRALLARAERERVHGRAHQRGAAGLAALGRRP